MLLAILDGELQGGHPVIVRPNLEGAVAVIGVPVYAGLVVEQLLGQSFGLGSPR